MNSDTPFLSTVLIVLITIAALGAIWGALHCHKIGFFTFCT